MLPPQGGFYTLIETGQSDKFTFSDAAFAFGGQIGVMKQFGTMVIGGEVSFTARPGAPDQEACAPTSRGSTGH